MSQWQATRDTVNRLLQSMLDAETGQRGYLLTGNDIYLQPYDKAMTALQSHMDTLRNQFVDSKEHPFQGVVPAPAAVTFAPQRENCGCGKKSWRGLRAMRR